MEQKEKKGGHEWNRLSAVCVSSVNMFKNNINISLPQKGGIHFE